MDDLISQQLARELVKKVAKEIDLDAMAKRVAPKVAKEIEAKLMLSLASQDWGDVLGQVLSTAKIWKMLEMYVESCLRERLGK